MKSTIILAALLSITGSMALAQTATTEVNTRQHTQQARIVHGKHTGVVTKREAHLLRMQQRHIRKAECRAKADGVVTPQEEKRLQYKQNQANRSIRRAKHNGLDRKG